MRAACFRSDNFQTGVMKKVEKISGEHMAETILKANKGCFACPIACVQMTEVEDPAFQGEGEGPEYRTIALIGAACGIADINAVAKISYLCDDMGIDTLSFGSAVACAMELTEKKIISKKQTGMTLTFGNAEAVIELIEKVANRRRIWRSVSGGGISSGRTLWSPGVFYWCEKAGISSLRSPGNSGARTRVRNL